MKSGHGQIGLMTSTPVSSVAFSVLSAAELTLVLGFAALIGAKMYFHIL